MRFTRRKQKGGAAKPAPRCQCVNPATGHICGDAPKEGSLFCEQHQNCPGAPLNGYEPEWDPKGWDDPAIYKSMNCYAYAMNFRDPGLVAKCRKNGNQGCREFFPQPGALNGDRYALNARERRDCPVVEKLMISDVPEIEKSDFYSKCPAGKSKIALVSHKGEDYHFYRQDSDGKWSHKDGSNKVKRFDALKRPIFNPEGAERDYRWQGSDLNYHDFCGFYCAPRDRPIRLGQGGASRSLWATQRKTRKQRQQTRRQRALLRPQSAGTRRNYQIRHPRSGLPF